MSKKPDPFLAKLGSQMNNAASAVKAAVNDSVHGSPAPVKEPVTEVQAGAAQMQAALSTLNLPRLAKETQTFNTRPADTSQIAKIKADIAALTGRSNISAGSAIRVALRSYKSLRALSEIIVEVMAEDGRGKR